MLLVSNDQRDVTDGLAKAKEACGALDAAGEAAKQFASVKSLLEAAPFTDQTWTRETLLSLAQWDFKFVPPSTADTIKTLFHGFGHSIIVDNCNNRIKDHYRDNKGCLVSRERRLYIPVARKLISGLYTRHELTMESAKQQALLSNGRPRDSQSCI